VYETLHNTLELNMAIHIWGLQIVNESIYFWVLEHTTEWGK
jgi:hypothetical protein